MPTQAFTTLHVVGDLARRLKSLEPTQSAICEVIELMECYLIMEMGIVAPSSDVIFGYFIWFVFVKDDNKHCVCSSSVFSV